MSSSELGIYFDYISPFAYFGWLRARQLAEKRKLKLRIEPVLFAGLLNHWGQLGPAEIPPKREYMFKTIVRYAVTNGLELEGPKTHPFNPLTALRLSLEEVAGVRQAEVIDTLYDAIWARGIDGASTDDLLSALDERGFDAASMLKRTQEPEIKAKLKASTAQAIERGVFGVPTFDCEDELFWGNDSLEYVEMRLDGKDPIDGRADKILNRPSGSQRKTPPR